MFPGSSGPWKEESLLICEGWEEAATKTKQEEDKEPAVEPLSSAKGATSRSHEVVPINVVPMVCPTPTSAQTLRDVQKHREAELQHVWALVKLSPLCAKQEIFFRSPVHACVFVVHVISQQNKPK